MAEQNPGRGGRGSDGAMEGQNPGRGGRGNGGARAAQNPGRGGRGNGGARAAQNLGRGGRGIIGAVVAFNPMGERGNGGALAAQNLGRRGRGIIGAVVAFNPIGGRGIGGARAAQNPGRGGRGNDGAMAAQNLGRGGRGIIGAMVAFNPMGGRGIIGDLAAAEDPGFLPPNEALGGYIFMCSRNTLPEITQLMVFGYPETFRDRVRAITPGLPLFLYNLSTRCLHGIYEAADTGGFNIEPRFCTCMNVPGRSFFPAQVRVRWRKEYQPLNEQITSGVMENLRIPQNRCYKYRVELRVSQAENIIDVFAANGVVVE